MNNKRGQRICNKTKAETTTTTITVIGKEGESSTLVVYLRTNTEVFLFYTTFYYLFILLYSY